MMVMDRKYTEEDVTPELAVEAIAYLENYSGNFDYLLDLKQRWNGGFGRTLSPAQIKGILNCMQAEAKRQAAQANEPPVEMADDGKHIVRNGTYTVEHIDGSYQTLRLKSGWDDLPKGTQVAQYLSGPDNENNFNGFAFVTGQSLRMWNRYRDNGQLEEALRVLLTGDAAEAGYRYAMESGNCYVCGRKLTVPASIHRGMGPVCAGL